MEEDLTRKSGGKVSRRSSSRRKNKRNFGIGKNRDAESVEKVGNYSHRPNIQVKPAGGGNKSEIVESGSPVPYANVGGFDSKPNYRLRNKSTAAPSEENAGGFDMKPNYRVKNKSAGEYEAVPQAPGVGLYAKAPDVKVHRGNAATMRERGVRESRGRSGIRESRGRSGVRDSKGRMKDSRGERYRTGRGGVLDNTMDVKIANMQYDSEAVGVSQSETSVKHGYAEPRQRSRRSSKRGSTAVAEGEESIQLFDLVFILIPEKMGRYLHY